MTPLLGETESDIALRMLANVVTHPIEYAKVLIQIGYEPIPPRPTVSLFRQPSLALPNIFQYVKYIKNVDGYCGLYRGLVPKLCANTVRSIVTDKTSNSIKFIKDNDDDDDEDEDDVDDSPKCKKCIYELIQELISRTIGIIVSHPLDVITLRMMAQFVGGETKYNGLFRSFVEVYKENGILGYYGGLIPRLIGNAASIILVSSSTYIFSKYVISDREIHPYIDSSMRFLVTTITYPFFIVSSCMGVNNCGLVAGLPPQMPIYNNWLDCWSHLSAHNQLKRGSTLLWRYYTGPQVIINGKAIPLSTDTFYPHSKTQ